jgi:Ca2+-transporting ATPase
MTPLHPDMSSGLSRSLVFRRQEEEGLNELPTSRPKRLHQIVLGVFREPMVYLLLGCGGVYLMVGDSQEALMLLGFLSLIIGIEIFQERKTERALEALRDLSSPRALVLRDGQKTRIPGKDVVREDLIFLSEGDRVPADALLMKSENLSTDESLLTGESVPVDKISEQSVFAGTTVIRGQGVAIVTAIGSKSEIGKIGASLHDVGREKTKLEKHTATLVKQVAWIAGAICILVFLIFAMTRSNWIDGFLVGLTLAMAILPNELPPVLTIFLALGAWRLSQRRVLTRRLPAVENLGSATVLCVDKTGTLTLNQMRIQKIFSNQAFLDLSSSANQNLPEDFHEVLEFAILASRQDPFDPMELAFVTAGVQYLSGTEHLHQDWMLAKEYPLSPALLAISHAWKPRREGGFVIGAKGAPEAIIDLCHLAPSERDRYSGIAESLAQEGLRVLGVAKAFSGKIPLPEGQHDFDFSFIGFIGLADPIRPGVPHAVAECKSAGVRVVMMTGDHPITARSIARQIGLENADQVLTGSQLAEMTNADLANALKNTNVFSRVSPSQKLKLVEIFKSNGEIVAMTGDGVNDAPALKSAHIGIAMGGRGTDVARESASIVLLDDDFGSIVEAIRMGRRVYANLKNALIYLFSVHIPITGMSVLPVVFKLPLVLLPAHIAFLHLIIEPASSIAFETQPAGASIMNQPPRNPKEPLFDKNLWIPSFIRGLSVLGALILIYLVALGRGQGEEDARALVFTTLMISNVFLIFFPKTLTFPLNRASEWLALISLMLIGVILYNPGLRELFKFSYLHVVDIVVCLALGCFSVVMPELLRYWRQHFGT